MSYAAQYTLATDAAAFLPRVEIAICTAAINVQAEVSTTTNHMMRVRLAGQVLGDPPTWAKLFAKAVATNALITTASLDSDIQFTVNSMWDAFALR